MKTKLLFILVAFTTLSNAQIVNIPDANFKARLLEASSNNGIASTETPVYDNLNGVWTVTTYHKIDTNNDNQIQLSEALAIKWLNVNGSIIQNFEGILSFTNLQYLDCSKNLMTSIELQGLSNLKALICVESITMNNIHLLTNLNLQGLTNLETLNCSFNNLSSLNIQNLTNLKYFNCNANAILTLDFNNLINLKYINCNNNQLTSLNVQGLLNLKRLECYYNKLLTLNIQGLNNLQTLLCSNNQLPSINVQGLTNLIDLNCSYNQIPSLNVQGLLNLQTLVCTNLQLTTLNLQGLTNLETLNFSSNQLTDLNIQGLTNNFKYLFCSSNQLTTLNVQALFGLISIDCDNNQLTNLNLQGLTNLMELNCDNNQISSINLQGLLELRHLNCQNNQLRTLDLIGLKMSRLNCSNNQIVSLNLEDSIFLQDLYCQDNLLTTLFIKNGVDEENVNYSNNSNLHYICCDESQLTIIQQQVIQNSQTNCQVNTYCTFIPGGNYNTISGNLKFNFNNNGCANLINASNFIKFSNVSNDEQVTISNQGQYVKYLGTGTYTLTPQIENPTLFNINPSNAQVVFSNNNYNAQTQDFCITPNGVHHDVEVTLIPITVARPGFNATYKIIYKNKGNQVENGTVTLTYLNQDALDIVSCNPAFNSENSDGYEKTLTWNYVALKPFETREITVVLNLNGPTETPPLNRGETLSMTSTVTPDINDKTPIDNRFDIRQVIVGSYDPNDKTCIEGTTITPAMVGEYVHYVIRFENTGTYQAENVVVKDMIDTSKFDINTLIPIKGSHDFETRISNTNKVEFIFENINLPFDDATNDGYIAFKIKTKPNLVLGNTFSNQANIYFDYNFPIVTNNYTTTVQNTLGLQENELINDIVAYPNPVKEFLNFKTEQNVLKVEVYDISGRILSSNSVYENKTDLSNLKTGNYMLKVYTEKGIINTKIIKE